jgi:hypothetical protein
VKQDSGSERLVLAGLTLALAARLAAGAALIPPWQGPDEPQHVFQITVLAGGYERFPDAEAALVGSMYRNNWWEHYQRVRPSVQPRTFDEGPAQITGVRGAPGGPILFHRLAASALHRAGVGDVEQQFWWLRFASAVMAISTFILLYFANRLAFGADVALVGSAILAFHPQFMLVSLSANPDAAVILLGALIWLSAAMAVNGYAAAAAVGIAWLCAIGAVLIRRLAAPFLLDAVAVSVLAVATSAARHVILGTAGVSVVALTGATWILAHEHAQAALSWMNSAFTPVEALRGLVADPPFVALLGRVLFQSFWFTAGWMRYEAPIWWYLAILTVSLFALVGCVRVFRRAAGSQGLLRVAMLTAAFFVMLQITAVFVAYIPIRAGVQGRYLMPVAGPALGLIALGLVRGWTVPPNAVRVAHVIAFFVVMDLLAWGLVLLPRYAWS